MITKEQERKRIERDGHMIASSPFWAYYLRNGVIYSISPLGEICFWCTEDRLARHLHRIWQITGRKCFSDDPYVTIVDHAYADRYIYF